MRVLGRVRCRDSAAALPGVARPGRLAGHGAQRSLQRQPGLRDEPEHAAELHRRRGGLCRRREERHRRRRGQAGQGLEHGAHRGQAGASSRGPVHLERGQLPGCLRHDHGPDREIKNGRPTVNCNPPVQSETPERKSWWQAASSWVHGALGAASFVPGLSVVTGGADALIYAAEGDAVEAGLAAASMIPGG